jgi:signal transduction histidine kinase/CheY-like chemotaxis protein
LKWSVAGKTRRLTLLLLVLLLVIAGYNYLALVRIGSEISEITKTNLPMMRRISQIESYQLRQHVAFERTLRLGTDATGDAQVERERVMTDFEQLSQQFDVSIQESITAAEVASHTVPKYKTFLKELGALQKEHREFVDSARYISTGTAQLRSTPGLTPLEERLAIQIGKQAADFDLHVGKILADIESFTEELTSTAVENQIKARNLSLVLSLTVIAIAFFCVVGISDDVTQRKQVADALAAAKLSAEAASRTKSEFLANMSHEIRTPMNAVIGMTSLLMDTDLSHEQRDFVKTIRSSGQSLLTVINDILDFSKIEAGMLQIEKQTFDLRDCVEAALDLVAPKAAEKGLDVAYLFSPDTPAGLVTDVTRVRQILVNLLSNAVKFTGHGEVVVYVTSKPRAGNVFETRFEVRDTGIGIPADRLDRLFKSFSQVDGSTSRHYGGTGLGLAISKSLAEMLGGEIGVNSTFGEGSTFHFTVVAEAAPVQGREYLSGPQPGLKGARLLCVEDNATNRRIVNELATLWGMTVQETMEPGEALEWIRRGDPFDVALLDMQLPGGGALTLAHEMRNHRRDMELPLILLTSLGQVSEGTRTVFSRTLGKPIRPSELFKALMNVLSGDPARLKASSNESEFDITVCERFPLRILLAEDNAVNQKVAVNILRRFGYHPDVAGNGKEVIEALRRQPYDLILMDVHMPEMDGLEATRQVRAEWPDGTGPRIMAMTAGVLPDEMQACSTAGMDGFLTKPISIGELRALLEGSVGPERTRMAPANSVAPLDPETVERLFELATDEDDVANEIIQSFVGDTPPVLASMRESIAVHDADRISSLAHYLKSSCGVVGAVAMTRLCRNLEDREQTSSVHGAADLVSRLETEFDRAVDALHTELRKRDRHVAPDSRHTP